MVGLKHAVTLDAKHRRVYIATRTVVVGGVNVYHQRLARHLLGVNAGRICQPVVGVYDVKLFGTCHNAGHYGVIVDLLKEIVGITA